MRARFACLDCREDVSKIKEYCMLVDSTWYLIHNSAKGMLCVGCIESRLGRRLIPDDFNESYLNRSRSFERSARLLDRMTNHGTTRLSRDGRATSGIELRSALRLVQSRTAVVV